MKPFSKLTLTAASFALCLAACAKNEPPKTEPEAPPTPVETAATTKTQATEPNADSLAQEQAKIEAERLAQERAKLEAERARLEELINKIMSEDVYFDFDRSELTEKAKELLAQVGELLIKESRFTITIEGHTDARGTEDYNFTLGAKRAMKVKEFLLAYGIDAKRMESVSYGKEAPKVEGTSEEAYSQNRRANFRVNIKE